MDSSQIKPVSHYEELREKVLQQQSVDLEYFLKHGLAEWLTFHETQAIQPHSMFSTNRLLVNHSASHATNTEIVSILAAVMFHHKKGDIHDNLSPSL